MIIVFLLPPIQGLPTGGNRYNDEVIRHLTPARCRPEVWPGEDTSAPWPADAVILVDSLLAVDPQAIEAIRVAAGARRKALLAHYLPQCDPSAPAFGERPPAAGRYVVPSRYMRDGLIRIGVDPGRIAVAYPGTSPGPGPAPTRSASPSAAPVRLVSVASQLPVKGLLEAAEVLAQLSNRDWQWDIAGDDSLDPAYSRRLADAVASGPLAGRVRLLGPRTHEEVLNLLAGADMLLAPSRFESLGMVVREAMAAGLPVAAFDVGGIAESVTHEQSGLLAPAGDLNAFRGAVGRLLDDPHLRYRLGASARQAARAFPGWRDTAATLWHHLMGSP